MDCSHVVFDVWANLEKSRSERVTTSVFVLTGSELKATTEFEGPIPSETPIQSGAQLYEALKHLESGMFGASHHALMREIDTVDFEHLNLGKPPEDPDDDEEVIPENESIEQRRERRARQRKKALETRQKREKHKQDQRAMIRREGEPVEVTRQVKGAGWYRFCIKSSASWGQITVEVDLRKESEMGGFNDVGHVLTSYEKAVLEEEQFLMQDTAETEGIKDEDFESTREQLKTLRRLIADIQSKQAQERHRLVVHSSTNQHSHSRMVLSSLLETVLFMAVTGYQVYTIRKWFRGAPVLGR
jgi:emp24/gp25L/p24 family/GOLD